MPTFRLAHLSDPHLPPPPLEPGQKLTLKQRLSRRAWRRKAARHQPQVLEAICADILTQQCDHICLTGDLANFGLPQELAQARAWLEQFSPPRDLTLSPGNHDALAPTTGNRTERDRWEPWRPWMEDEPGAFPAVRIRAGFCLVNLCSGVPTPLLLAQGSLGEDQLARAETVLRQAGEAGLARIILVHHPVVDGVVSGRKALTDAAGLRAVIARAGCELVLHGHDHTSFLGAVEGPGGRSIPVMGAASASSPGGHDEPASWRLIEITPKDAESPSAAPFSLRATLRGLDSDGQVRELGRYSLV